jgi:hypothetical protein
MTDMTDVDRLLQEFIAADRGGEVPDPLAFLGRVPEGERAELSALLDGYLGRAPRRAFSPAEFSLSPARPLAEALDRSLSGSSGAWPAVLPRLRDRARLRRAEVVSRLAAELGAGDREAKVAGYYHAMEQGTLPAAGVSDRVLEALGRIVGESAGALRAAGRAMTGPPPAPRGGRAFARVASPDPGYTAAPAAASSSGVEPSRRDEVDELFTQGGRSR